MKERVGERKGRREIGEGRERRGERKERGEK